MDSTGRYPFCWRELTISYSNAWGADWKEFADATTGTFYYDAAGIRSPSAGTARVWIHNVTQHETSLIEFTAEAEVIACWISSSMTKRDASRAAMTIPTIPTG